MAQAHSKIPVQDSRRCYVLAKTRYTRYCLVLTVTVKKDRLDYSWLSMMCGGTLFWCHTDGFSPFNQLEIIAHCFSESRHCLHQEVERLYHAELR